MRSSTLGRLRCPRRKKARVACGAELELRSGAPDARGEVSRGTLACLGCRAEFPILAGVAVLVDDVRGYLCAHAKGISAQVSDSEIPREHLRDYRTAKAEIRHEGIEEDLEAQRVNALYLMNHYLRVDGATEAWWRPRDGQPSPLIDELVRAHWDQGPLARIEAWVRELGRPEARMVELGCGVGGLSARVRGAVSEYLGVDSAFASISLARHLALGAPYRGQLLIPEDLLQGGVSRKIHLPAPAPQGTRDFVVGELESPPLARGAWDVAAALNTIDMLEDPRLLPELSRELLAPGGLAIQSCPYIWHERIAKKLRARLPREVRDSAGAVEWLYEQAGLRVRKRLDHVPWLFFKHVRQLEVYSVHMFIGCLK